MFEFMTKLSAKNGTAARATEFCILTAVRKEEARKAMWSEIDFGNKVWNIPAERMKGGRKAHSVPLAPRTCELLKALPREEGNPFVFIGAKAGHPVGSLFDVKRINKTITQHGFRSSFRDWAAERTHFQNHVVEQALAHAIGSAVERAYRRGDLFDHRVRLMEAWADYCYVAPTTGKVLKFA
jgi:integrase